MPPISGAPPCGAAAGAGLSAITHSVVNNIDAIDAAFSNATLYTLVGSITPAFNKFSKTSVLALKP
jgi:hypothetical protein